VKLTSRTHYVVTKLRMSATVHFVPHWSYLDIIPISPSSRPTRYVNRGSSRSVTLNCRDLLQVRPASCVVWCGVFGALVSPHQKFVPWVVSVWSSGFMTNATPCMSGRCVGRFFISARKVSALQQIFYIGL
jgi:hypothetical protein